MLHLIEICNSVFCFTLFSISKLRKKNKLYRSQWLCNSESPNVACKMVFVLFILLFALFCDSALVQFYRMFFLSVHFSFHYSQYVPAVTLASHQNRSIAANFPRFRLDILECRGFLCTANSLYQSMCVGSHTHIQGHYILRITIRLLAAHKNLLHVAHRRSMLFVASGISRKRTLFARLHGHFHSRVQMQVSAEFCKALYTCKLDWNHFFRWLAHCSCVGQSEVL